jgi:hypothetical protein
MEWCHLEGTERVLVSYRVWRQCCRDLRELKKKEKFDPLEKQHKRFLKEDVQIELDELIDSILSLTPKENDHLLKTVKKDKLYRLISLYK